jgi:hypothetical protein
MKIEDLEYIFQKQLADKEEKLYFMLILEDGKKLIERHFANELDSLLVFLDNFIFGGFEPAESKMPRFIKWNINEN